MASSDVQQVHVRFAEHGFERGVAINHLIESGLLGIGHKSPLYPWGRVGIAECMPASDRFPRSTLPRDLLLFARRCDIDQVACVEKKTGKIVELHYDLSNPAFLEITRECGDAWAWLVAIVGDLKVFHDE